MSNNAIFSVCENERTIKKEKKIEVLKKEDGEKNLQK